MGERGRGLWGRTVDRSLCLVVISCFTFLVSCGPSDKGSEPTTETMPAAGSMSTAPATAAGTTAPAETVATTAPAETTVPDTRGALRASCGDVYFGAPPVDLLAFPPLAERMPELDLSAMEQGGLAGAASFFERYLWSIASQTADDLVLFGQPPGGVAIDPPFASASLRRAVSGWELSDWGQCRIEVAAPGWGTARFILGAEPAGASTTLSVLATEVACASGIQPTDREIRPVVIGDALSVSIVILVEPPQGDQVCPSNPPFPVEVDLGAPLAGRTVIDASVQPGLARPWPPTNASVESRGLTE